MPAPLSPLPPCGVDDVSGPSGAGVVVTTAIAFSTRRLKNERVAGRIPSPPGSVWAGRRPVRPVPAEAADAAHASDTAGDPATATVPTRTKTARRRSHAFIVSPLQEAASSPAPRGPPLRRGAPRSRAGTKTAARPG